MTPTGNFPFAIHGIIGQHWTSSSDSNLRILFGIRGSWQILTEESVYEMSAEDVLVLNAFQAAQVTATSVDSALFLIEIYREEIENQLNIQWTPVFDCNSMAEKQFAYQEKEFSQLREKLLACLATFYDLKEQNQFAVYEKFFSMLSFLKSHFQRSDFQIPAAYDEKIQQVLTTIHLNYMKPLTLQQIAEETFLSYHYLSRKFKEEVGVSFKEYLTTYRLKKSATALRISEQSILKIALENGFTNSKAFHLAFKNYYGITPNDYRHQQASEMLEVGDGKKVKADNFELLEIEAAMLVLSNFMVQKDPEEFLEPKQLERQIPLTKPLKPRSTLPKILNIGHCSNWLRGDAQQALLETCQGISFDYLRFNDVLIENQLIIDTFDILPNHAQMSRLISFAMENHLTPIIHFKIPKDNQIEFSSWLEPRLKVLQRLVDEFGDSSNTWHLEFDLDPLPVNLKENFLFFYQQMQRIFDQPTIGLNVGALYRSPVVDQLEEFLADLNEQHLTIAFVDYRSDPSDDYLWDELPKNLLKDYQEYNLTTLKALLEKYHCGGKVFLSEWNTLIGKGTTLRGTFFRSAIMLKDILYLAEEIEGIGFWLNNSIQSNSPEQPLTGQNRLTLYVGHQLKRPVFFVLQMFDRIKGSVLYQEESIYLTQQGRTRYLLLLNPTYFNPAMSIDETYMMYQSQLIKLELQHLESGLYQINTYTLDKDHGGIYNEVLKTSGLELVDQEATDYLKQAILPQLEISCIEVEEQLTFKELLSFNACRLIQIKPLHN
ncbi:helix-turn-helix domain-containing protein [Enterococcus sp. AZ163]|uniref:helix-turn-helix domain-containing protein n=1 Tax=Enterococcus sp. AZ163 TaxID=2774638 RepID=UPI003D2E037A